MARGAKERPLTPLPNRTGQRKSACALTRDRNVGALLGDDGHRGATDIAGANAAETDGVLGSHNRMERR